MKRIPIERSALFIGSILIGSLVILAGCSPAVSPTVNPSDGGSATSRVTRPDTPLALVSITDASSYSSAVGARASDGRIAVANARVAVANGRIADANGRIAVANGRIAEANARASALPGGGGIYLRAEVRPPATPEGTSLQASHVALPPSANYAFVGYMLQGDAAYGALDVFDISNPSYPVLVTTALFPGIDISVVAYDASVVYLGGQKTDETGKGESAWVGAYDFTGNGHLASAPYAERSLPGYFVTDISVKGDVVYLTTGSQSPAYPATNLAVGAYALSRATLATTRSDTGGLPDARSIIAGGNAVAAFTAQWANPATSAAVRIYDESLTEAKSIALGATATAESKSGMAYFQGAGTLGRAYYAVALNQGGVAIVDPEGAGSVIATIPAPSLASIAADRQASNSISAGEANSAKLFFIANGEAGLWVGNLASINDAAASPAYGIEGTIRFGAGQSVNYAASKNRVVVAAAGTGGLKILELTVK